MKFLLITSKWWKAFASNGNKTWLWIDNKANNKASFPQLAAKFGAHLQSKSNSCQGNIFLIWIFFSIKLKFKRYSTSDIYFWLLEWRWMKCHCFASRIPYRLEMRRRRCPTWSKLAATGRVQNIPSTEHGSPVIISLFGEIEKELNPIGNNC